MAGFIEEVNFWRQFTALSGICFLVSEAFFGYHRKKLNIGIFLFCAYVIKGYGLILGITYASDFEFPYRGKVAIPTPGEYEYFFYQTKAYLKYTLIGYLLALWACLSILLAWRYSKIKWAGWFSVLRLVGFGCLLGWFLCLKGFFYEQVRVLGQDYVKPVYVELRGEISEEEIEKKVKPYLER